VGVIRILEENVANQIAAGEVVERPSSVVKELLENALDAGASRIDLELAGGGADLIRVADDGCGMDRDDALLALQRHATSKIGEARDLQAIATFGFRGEALPSIASVSRLLLTTSTGGREGGTRVRVVAGSVERVEPASHPRGTTVQVEALFHNAPARRKFLRSAPTETARIGEVVATLAAAHPAVAFTMRSGGRTIASYPAAPSYRERVAQAAGEEASVLLEVEGRAGGMRLGGLASVPALHRATSRDLRLYVNGRPVRDRRILHAVQEAYATLLPRGRWPVIYLFLEIPSDQVDVNVHPAKSEVRFLRPGAVHALVRDALREGLRRARPFAAMTPTAHAVGEALPEPWGVERSLRPQGPPGWSRSPEDAREAREGAPPAPTERALIDGVAFAPLAQFRETYILAAAPDGLVIVDQHAAHERVLYESLLEQGRAGRAQRQRLLFPLTPEVSPAQRQGFEVAAEALEAIGFQIVPFGETTLRIDEVPALLPAAGIERLVRDLLDEVLEWRRVEGVDRLRHRVAASAACHAAVTANQPLDDAEMGRIVTDLMRTGSPMTCPHGRPVLLRLTLEQLEREFRRR